MIDFTLVGLILCVVYEIAARSFDNYYSALIGKVRGEDISTGNCLMALFYIFFVIYLLWNPILWLPALLLIVLGILTSGVLRPITNEIKKLLKTGIPEEDTRIQQKKAVIKSYFVIDKLLSLALLGWMIYLQLTQLGIIA